MGNLGGFKSCSNICTCQQKNIVIPSEFMVNVNETTKANNNNNKKTEDNVKREIKNDIINNAKRLIKFSNLESVNSLTPLLIKIDTEYRRLNILEKSRTNNDKNENSNRNSHRTNQTRRNILLRKLTEKNNKETCDENDISNIKSSNNPNSKNQENKSLFSYSTSDISKNEENMLYNFFKQHYLFMEYNNDFYKILINHINILEIEKDICIFKKGEMATIFFIIKSGDVILKNETTNKRLKLSNGDSFGEISLINPNCYRAYSAYAKTKIELYSITYDLFQELLNLHANNLYKYNHLNTSEIVEKKKEHLSHFYLFQKLNDIQKENLFSLIRAYEINKENLLLHINKKDVNKKPLFITHKDLFYVMEGEIEEKFINDKYSIIHEKGGYAGTIYTFFKSYDKQVIEIINKSNKTVILFIPEKAFFESIGLDYKYQILFDLFIEKISKIELITHLINLSTPNQDYDAIFESFTLNEYKEGDIVIPKSTYENKKICLLLYGELTKNNKIILTNGQMIGESLINSTEE